MKKLSIATALLFIIVIAWLIIKPAGGDRSVLVGHNASPLLAFLYAAAAEDNSAPGLLRMGSSADTGYALLSGSLDAGFVELYTYKGIQKLAGYDRLAVAGAVTFPYGATLIIPRKAQYRLGDLPGKKLAFSAGENALLKKFIQDALRFSVHFKEAEFAALAPDAIIPALEAGSIDGVVLRGARSLAARRAGHTVLYQNWEMDPGPGCCGTVVEQIEYVLLLQKDLKGKATLLASLRRAASLDSASLRLARKTHVPELHEEGLPLGTFIDADDALAQSWEAHAGHAD